LALALACLAIKNGRTIEYTILAGRGEDVPSIRAHCWAAAGILLLGKIGPPRFLGDICKWKERNEGRRPRNQKSTAKDKKREPKTKLQKKCGSKKEDLKKKTLSRNRPAASIQTD
jgi:hypothetical protein